MKKLTILETITELEQSLGRRAPNSACDVPAAHGTLYIGTKGFRFEGNIDISRLTRDEILDALSKVLNVEVKLDLPTTPRSTPVPEPINECNHEWDYTPDPSGNNDSHRWCKHCKVEWRDWARRKK
jgi:hypothetical protein